MDIPDVQRWYDAYLDDFIALARGDDDDTARLLRHYGVPLLLGTDTGVSVLADRAQVGALMQEQIDALRTDGYASSELVESETVLLNRACATHRARVSRVRADGSVIARLQATYLVAQDGPGYRISSIVTHTAP